MDDVVSSPQLHNEFPAVSSFISTGTTFAAGPLCCGSATDAVRVATNARTANSGDAAIATINAAAIAAALISAADVNVIVTAALILATDAATLWVLRLHLLLLAVCNSVTTAVADINIDHNICFTTTTAAAIICRQHMSACFPTGNEVDGKCK